MVKGHFIKSKGLEGTLGFALAIIGCILVWDAFDNRGKKLPWPLSGFMPW